MGWRFAPEFTLLVAPSPSTTTICSVGPGGCWPQACVMNKWKASSAAKQTCGALALIFPPTFSEYSLTYHYFGRETNEICDGTTTAFGCIFSWRDHLI